MAQARIAAAKLPVLSTVGRGYAEFGRMFPKPLWLVIGVWGTASYFAMDQARSWSIVDLSPRGHEIIWLLGVVLLDIVRTTIAASANALIGMAACRIALGGGLALRRAFMLNAEDLRAVVAWISIALLASLPYQIPQKILLMHRWSQAGLIDLRLTDTTASLLEFARIAGSGWALFTISLFQFTLPLIVVGERGLPFRQSLGVGRGNRLRLVAAVLISVIPFILLLATQPFLRTALLQYFGTPSRSSSFDITDFQIAFRVLIMALGSAVVVCTAAVALKQLSLPADRVAHVFD